MTRQAPVGHGKVLIPGPSSAAMGSHPDFVDYLVVTPASSIKATAPSPHYKTLW